VIEADQDEAARRTHLTPASKHDVIVIGASAGGVSALTRIFGKLPSGNFAAAIFVVLHTSSRGHSNLAAILSRAGGPRVHVPENHERICFGEVYVAPSNHHLIIEDGSMQITTGPKENRHRPAIDPLFRTAAESLGARVIGVVLTGTLDDGTAGLWEIKRRGGIAVVQDPEDAEFPQMPKSALANVNVDHVVALDDLSRLLVSLCNCEAET
jgi:two-component system, chemotaxis family, protein-glutamate methylesterase/glutaminase